MKLSTALDFVKLAAATVTDTLATIGERAPGISQITIAGAGASITVTPTPKPPAAPTCPHCGAPKP